MTMMLVATAMAASPSTVAGDASADGRELYIQYGCYQCHGYEGQGGYLSGPRIAPDPPPFEAFSVLVRRPAGSMPAYSPQVLDERALRRIHRYLSNIAPPDVGL